VSEQPIRAYRVLEEQVVGQGGFLTIRRLRLRLEREDGSLTDEGLYDFVERPVGLDAVVLGLWCRTATGIEVLLRDALRVPLDFGRADRARRPTRFTEVVAGILEVGEESEAAIRRRAAAEALEEAGLSVPEARIELLGAPLHPTPGMCPELFHLAACEVTLEERAAAVPPPLDGSPFEEGARLRWVGLDAALAECESGAIADMKTEVLLRRLRARL
jgi:8-oxo-dGTP pyrophosphatase MutT (NUDIX family)